MNFSFAFPMTQLPLFLAIGLATVIGVALGIRFLESMRVKRLNRFVELSLTPRLLPGHDASRRRPLTWLTVIGTAALLVALAQPRWGESPTELIRQSRDVLIALDISESMNAQDMLPSRLERAKQKIEALVRKSPNDRFGLVAFSGAAELICPLTLDHGYFFAVLEALDTNSITREGTDISEALRISIKSLEEQDAIAGVNESAFRAVVLISDGEQVQGDAVAFSNSMKDYARFFVAGVGDPQGSVVSFSVPTGRRGERQEMEPHVSRLDETTLSQIATAGGGAYVRATSDNADIEELDRLIRSIAVRETAGGVKLSLTNRYQWPLGIAIVCFLLEGLWLVLLPRLRERRAQKMGHEGALSHGS